MNDVNTSIASMPEAARISSRTLLPEASVPQLPPLSINNMTQVQLKQLIPLLMRAVSNKEIATTISHPCWWPPDIPWVPGLTQTAKGPTLTDNMKEIVRRYYRHLGQENMLCSGKLSNWRLSLAKLQALLSRQSEQSHSMKTGKNSGKTYPGHSPFVGIYMCFFCSKEFVNKEDMRKHQSTCIQKPHDIQSVGPPSKNTRRSPVKGSGLHLFIPQLTVSVDQFMQKLNLVPLLKAKKLRECSRKSTEVNTIDFSDPEVPISPTTPKTPKLLITQLSRDQDSHSCKRRLSYMSHKENVSDTESTVSSENEEPEGKRHVKKAISLFSIPVSSVLGGRVLKHMVADSTPHVSTNTEEFCKTPKKNKFVDRLRARDNAFPISYKPRRRYRFHHSYKFSKAQRKEFMTLVNSGLDRNSRKLKRSLPKCTVQLTRLTKKEIKKYQRLPKSSFESLNPTVSVKRLNESYFFPRKPILLTQNIDRILGLRKKKQTAKLSPMNVVSENTNVEMLKQKVAVYRSLLTDLSMSTAKQKLKFAKKESQLKTKSADGESASDLVAHKYLQVQRSLHSAEKKKNGNLFSVKHHFPQLSDLLKKNPMPSCVSTPSSMDSSPESVECPLKIDIPSPEPSLSRFIVGCELDKKLREQSSPDTVSIRTVSSDEDSWREHCCMGCQLRNECRCTPCQGVEEAEEVVKSGECTPCKNEFLSTSTAKALFPQNVSCKTMPESPKENVLKESSVHLQVVDISLLTPVKKNMQTRSSISTSSGTAEAAAALSLASSMKNQGSARAACNLYSLRSNPAANVLTDSSNRNENLKTSKSSEKESSVSHLSCGRVQSLDESPPKPLQRSLSSGLASHGLDANVRTSRSLRSSLSSLSSSSTRHSYICDSPRPSTRNSPAKVTHLSVESLSDVSKPSRQKFKNLDMIRKSSYLKDVIDCQKSESDLFVSDRLKGSPVRNLRFASITNNEDMNESAENIDDDLDISDQFTRVDADILLKNVKTVNCPSVFKQKPLSKHMDSLTVNNSPRLRKRSATWSQSNIESHCIALKRKRLDL